MALSLVPSPKSLVPQVPTGPHWTLVVFQPEKNGKEAPIKVTIRSTIYSFLLIFLAAIDQTLPLSNYLGDSFPQTEQPPKSELAPAL